jgi:hypothetical protein
MLQDWNTAGELARAWSAEPRTNLPNGNSELGSARGERVLDPEALIYRPCRSATTSGRARTKHWVLRFERRRPKFTEPLMGWTGDDDPQAQVEISFPDLNSAMSYAERQGLSFRVLPAGSSAEGPYGQAVKAMFRAYLNFAWDRAANVGSHEASDPELDRALVSPAAVFRSPNQVADHPWLDRRSKEAILQQWAWDEYLAELATSEAVPDGPPSRLAEVKAARARLDQARASNVVLTFAGSGRGGELTGV